MIRSLILAVVCACLMVPESWAWGRKGHAAIAALAEADLSPVAKAQVRELLADDLDRAGRPSGRTTLAAVASWPDEVRDIAPADAYKGWHTRSNQVCTGKAGPCKFDRCVDRLIISYGEVLGDKRMPLRERNEALKWVVHLVGDLHQPMHSGVNIDGGGLRAVLSDDPQRRETTLHALWDNEIGLRALAGGPLVIARPAAEPLPRDAPTQWMEEARDIALRRVYEPLPAFACNERLAAPVVISEAYLKQAAAASRTQMERAASRLARLLNELLR